MILFTDGLIEAVDARSEPFGEQRLASCLKQYADHSPAEMLAHALETARAFGGGRYFEDDVCAVCVERN